MELIGGIGKFSTIGGSGAELEINLESATQFFRQLTVQKESITENSFDKYGFLPLGRDGKAKLLGMNTPKHSLQGRSNCKTWNPKGRATLAPDVVSSMAIEYNGEQCGDDFAHDCFEKLLTIGPDKYDMNATSEGQSLMGMLVDSIYTGVSNDYHDMANFSRHPLIQAAEDAGSWDENYSSNKEWSDFYGQMFATDNNGDQVKGVITLIDEEKTDGKDHFNLSFAGGVGDWSDTDGTYTGASIRAEFDKCIRGARPLFKPMVRRRSRTQGIGAMFLVSISVFDAFMDEVIDKYDRIPESYRLYVDGEAVPGVFAYKGIPVIAQDEWEAMDDMLGIYTHRIILTAPRNLGIAYSVDPVSQRTGMGMVIQRSPLLKEKGIYHMYTTFRLGTYLSDTDLMVNMSLHEAKA